MSQQFAYHRDTRQGTAILLALVFGVILLQFAIAYTSMVRQSRPQTEQIDERVRLQYLANGLSEIALLKYQKFPSDFYNCWRYQASNPVSLEFWKDANCPLADFTHEAPEFLDYKVNGFTDSNSSFNTAPVKLWLLDVRLMTDNPWGVEALQIRSKAEYTGRSGRTISVVTGRTVRTERVI